MTPLRKLELVSGLGTGLLSVVLSLLMLKIDRDTAQRLEREFVMWDEVKLALGLFILPGLVIAIGSYLHTIKQNAWARVAIAVATLFFVTCFLISLVAIVWVHPAVWPFLYALLIILAVLTTLMSLLTKRERT